MISPTEVSRMAYVPNDQQLNQISQFYTQIAAQERARRDAEKLQRDKMDSDFDNALLNKLAATNTPYDEIGIIETEKAINNIANFKKENPRATTQQKQQYALEQISPAVRNREMAKSIYGQFDESTKDIEKLYPYVNKANLKKDFSRSVLYDENGQLRPTLNMGALQDPRFDLQNIENQDRYTEDGALEPIIQKSYREGLQPQSGFYSGQDNQGKLVDVKYTATPLQRFNPKTNSLELNTDVVDVNGKVYEVLKPEVVIPIADKNEYKIRKNREIKKLISNDPTLADQPTAFIDKLADTELAKKYAFSEKAGITDISYERQYKLENEKRQQELLRLAKNRDARAAEIYKMNKAKYEKSMKEEPYSPNGIYSTILLGTKYDKDAPLSNEAMNMVKTKYAIPFDRDVYDIAKNDLHSDTKKEINRLPKDASGNIKINQVAPFMLMTDLSASMKDGVFYDTKSLQPYKLIAVYDEENPKQPTLVKKYMKQNVNPETKKTYFETDIDELTLKPKVKKVDKVEEQLGLIGEQILGTTKKEKAEVEPYLINEEPIVE